MQLLFHVETAFAVGILVGFLAASVANAKAACAIRPPAPEKRSSADAEEKTGTAR